MVNIELQDALFIYILAYLLGLILMLFISFKYRNKIKGIGFFNFYFLFSIIGMLGVYFRLDLNNWVSTILISLVLPVSFLFLLFSILRFLGKKTPYLLFTIFSLIYVLLFIFFTGIYFDVFARIVVYGVAIVLIQGYIVYILYQNNKENDRKMDLLSFILIIYILIHIFRIIGLLNKVSQNTFFDYKFDSINVIILGLTGSFIVTGILSLINNKLLNEVHESECSLDTLLENIPIPAFVHNREGKMIKLSKTFTEISGYSIEDIPSIKRWTESAYEGNKVLEIRDRINNFFIDKKLNSINKVIIKTKDHKNLDWIFHSGYLGLNRNGEEMAISLALDTTESNRLKDNLTITESRLNLAQSIAKVGSWELDLATKKIWASKVAFEIYEVEGKNEFIGLSFIQTMRDKDDMELVDQALIDLIKKNKPYDITFRIHTPSKKMKYIHSRAVLIKNDNGVPVKVLGVFQDITSIKEKEFQLEHSAYNDFLTGVHNRRYYEENLAIMDIEENYPITIVMADINGLKLINDAFGHTSGDNLLISAARLFKAQSRDLDIVARIGGDEFVMVMPKTSEKEAEEIIDRINEKAKEVFIQSIELSISFGYKTKHKNTEEIQEIYRSAEDLMYREKLLEIPSMRSSAIEAILTTLYEKDKNSEVHSRSVSIYSERIAQLYGLDRQSVQEVKTAGILHDIGKIITPIHILQKEGKLTNEEYETIKNHSEIGFRILNSTSDMRNISYIILNHHERWDGTGYPRRVRGEDIPLKSRIIAIADAFDAMTSERTYRNTISHEEAVQELIANSGSQFDPKLVEIFKDNYVEITKE